MIVFSGVTSYLYGGLSIHTVVGRPANVLPQPAAPMGYTATAFRELAKTDSPAAGALPEKNTVASAPQLAKAFSPKSTTVAGNVTSTRAAQPLKALAARRVTGMVSMVSGTTNVAFVPV